jgi:hypothetical protein
MKKPEQIEIESKVKLDSGVVIQLRSYAAAIRTTRGKFLRYDLGRIITAISLAAGADDFLLIRISKIDDYSDSLNLLKIALRIDAKKFAVLLTAIRTDQGAVKKAHDE